MLLKMLYLEREDIEECSLREKDTGSSIHVELPQRFLTERLGRVERGVYMVVGKEIWEGPYVGMAGSCFSVRRRLPPRKEFLRKRW
jgi:hypothetical protein